MKKKEKGQPGYIKWKKGKYLAGTIAEFSVVIALVILGYVQTKTRLNMLTLFAILGCLPASKMLVEFIAMAPHQSIENEKYKEIETNARLLTRMYDLIITNPEKVMPVDVIVVSGHTVIGYTSSDKTDEVRCSRYLKDMLNANHHEKMTVKIFHDYKAFLSRVEGMNNIVEVGHTENGRADRAVRKLILSTCM